MVLIPFTPTKYLEGAFSCPNCNSYVHQIWHSVRRTYSGMTYDIPRLKIAICKRCQEYTIWHDDKMIYPEDPGILPPNSDLGEETIAIYMEARSILNKSPRAAAALLRLCIQKLFEQLGQSGYDIKENLKNLTGKGVPVEIVQAFDIVRVTGDLAVYPGQIDLKDDRDIALRLFEIVNIIAEVMITQPKRIKKLFAKGSGIREAKGNFADA